MTLIVLVAALLGALILGWVTSQGVKSNVVRAIDVFVYGPSLLAISWWVHVQQGPLLIQIALIVMSATTVTYNLRNWIAATRKK